MSTHPFLHLVNAGGHVQSSANSPLKGSHIAGAVEQLFNTDIQSINNRPQLIHLDNIVIILLAKYCKQVHIRAVIISFNSADNFSTLVFLKMVSVKNELQISE
jgi:hypothetical protein